MLVNGGRKRLIKQWGARRKSTCRDFFYLQLLGIFPASPSTCSYTKLPAYRKAFVNKYKGKNDDYRLSCSLLGGELVPRLYLGPGVMTICSSNRLQQQCWSRIAKWRISMSTSGQMEFLQWSHLQALFWSSLQISFINVCSSMTCQNHDLHCLPWVAGQACFILDHTFASCTSRLALTLIKFIPLSCVLESDAISGFCIHFIARIDLKKLKEIYIRYQQENKEIIRINAK